ncbi:hypothetical protein BJ508DRAFT_414811 [Ascobolus immersus RN42]|uniref:Uncharacterized protein n=1 Tax=Ascobolus immersus RN42 TaxID=1160509 RepID=A0A3N4I7C9_ASCIM|nr:hypothetical protein BJ508DRAFT_414811 [Ascobolus immersus RN42]
MTTLAQPSQPQQPTTPSLMPTGLSLPRVDTFELEGSMPGHLEPEHHARNKQAEEPKKNPAELEQERSKKSTDPAVLVNIPQTPDALAYETARREKAEGFDPKFPGDEGGPLAAAGAKLKTAAEDAVKKVTALAKDMGISNDKGDGKK